jgi:hypothetical protein
MLDFLNAAFPTPVNISPSAIFLRLAVAVAFGAAIAWIYRKARGGAGTNGSFPGTLVLLCVLISVVTQVIGDNVARAFSLVGALSIVRFRTVVRDTQDTAYVIFAVVIGMAVGAHDLWVASIGLAVVGSAAWFLCRTPVATATLEGAWLLQLRLNVGLDPETTIGPIVDAHVARRELVSAETARQGIALELEFAVGLKRGDRPDALVKALNGIEGVQSVALRLRTPETI